MDLEMTVTPIIVLDKGDRIIYKNAAAKKMLPFCRRGTMILRYLSYSGESNYLELVRQNADGCKIIEFSRELGRCYRALAIVRDGVAAMVFLPLLQVDADDILSELSETLAYMAAGDIMDFIMKNGEFVDRPAPASTWNYTRRNTVMYDFASEVGAISACPSLPLSSTLARVADVLSSRLSVLSLRFRITMRGSAVQLTPISDIAAFVYAFIPSSMMICEASGGACYAEIECYGETATARIVGEIKDRAVPENTRSLSELGELLDGDMPTLMIGDAAVEAAGAEVILKQRDGELIVELSFPMKAVMPSHLFSPEEEKSLTERFVRSIESALQV